VEREAMSWKFGEAKNGLDEVLTKASTEGPQTIWWKGEEFVVLPRAAYERLVGRPSFTDWLLNGPRIDDLELPARRSWPTM
jgi:prevent-host-death family protein